MREVQCVSATDTPTQLRMKHQSCTMRTRYAFQTTTPLTPGVLSGVHALKCHARILARIPRRRARTTEPLLASGCTMLAGRARSDKSGDPARNDEMKQEPDFIERAYTFLFGAKQQEPFGLKRFDRDRFPELYPATLDEFADPVESDNAEMALLRPMLARTQLQTRELQCVYDANRDGWDSTAFHRCADRRGASIVLAYSSGAVFGGYNPKGFVGYGESRGSKAAFLFTWADGNTEVPPLKLRKVGGAALAVVDEPDAGPKFGADALVIPLKPPRAEWEEGESDRMAMSKLGSYYERRPDGGNCLFADGESGKGTVLKEFRVFSGVYAEGEEIPFDDALPFSLE